MKKYLALTLISLSGLTAVAHAAKPECGTTGKLEARIKNCNYKKGGFELVMRLAYGTEVYYERESMLLWSQKFSGTMNSLQAARKCEDYEHGNFKGIDVQKLYWTVPSIYDYKEADSHGIRKALPEMKDNMFWTSSGEGDAADENEDGSYSLREYYAFGGSSGNSYLFDKLESSISLRCVARYKGSY